MVRIVDARDTAVVSAGEIERPVPHDRPVATRRLVRGALTFAAAGVLQRAAPLLLLPLFSRVLTPGEFGQIGVILTLAALVGTLVGLGLETSVFRGYLERSGDADAQARFTSTLVPFGAVAPALIALFVALVGAPLADRVFDVEPGALVLGCVGAALNVSAAAVPLALLRAQERLRDYLSLTWVQIGASVGLSVLFVAVFQWGIYGWMAATVLSAALLLARGLMTVRQARSRTFDRRSLAAALGFGLPLVPHAAAHWGLAVSDRAILGAFVAPSVVGTYYVAYLLALPVTLVSISLSQATQPLNAEAAMSDVRRRELGEVITMQALGVAVTTSVVALLGPPVAALVLPADYAGVGVFLPWLAVGAGLFGLYLIPMNVVTITVGKTRRVWLITVTAALVNVTLNLLTVPKFGAMAAAVNTCVGYGVLAAGVLLYANRIRVAAIHVDAAKLVIGIGAISAAVLAAALLPVMNPGLAVVVRTSLLAGVMLGLFAWGPLRAEARAAISALRPARNGAPR